MFEDTPQNKKTNELPRKLLIVWVGMIGIVIFYSMSFNSKLKNDIKIAQKLTSENCSLLHTIEAKHPLEMTRFIYKCESGVIYDSTVELKS